MFQDLELRARRALGSIYKEDVSWPLVRDAAGYLAFFNKVVERLEGGAKKVGELFEEESRDLLAQDSPRAFSHLFRSDPDFDLEAVIDAMPEVIRDALAEWVEEYVDALSSRFAPDSLEDQCGTEEHEDDDGKDGNVASP